MKTLYMLLIVYSCLLLYIMKLINWFEKSVTLLTSSLLRVFLRFSFSLSNMLITWWYSKIGSLLKVYKWIKCLNYCFEFCLYSFTGVNDIIFTNRRLINMSLIIENTYQNWIRIAYLMHINRHTWVISLMRTYISGMKWMFYFSILRSW